MLGSVARKYAHKIPFIVKINHNERLTLPNKFDQVLFGAVRKARNKGMWRWARQFILVPTSRHGS